MIYCGRYFAYLKNLKGANDYVGTLNGQLLDREDVMDIISGWYMPYCEGWDERIELYPEKNNNLPQGYPNWRYRAKPE